MRDLGEGAVRPADAQTELRRGEATHGERQLEPLAQARVEVRAAQQRRDRLPAEEEPRLGPPRAQQIAGLGAPGEQDAERDDPPRHGCAAARAGDGRSPAYCMR